jgi:uncharacterized membrane protein YqjE
MEDAGKRATGQLGEYGYATRDRSAGEIVKDILASAQEIIRSEVRLAKAEVREEATKAINAGTMLGGGAVVALYGLGFLFAAATAALALVIPFWAAALIVGGVLAIGGGAAIMAGLARWKTVHPAPEKTIADVKENVEWLKRQTKS